MANVSVPDVLREAAEYLCKLGNNLKLRSENLKVKRLSKDKLKNTQSVKKAADKMLVICKLSKQSIDNVEENVLKILNVCQSNIVDPNRNVRRNSSQKRVSALENNEDYQPFKMGSKEIRVPGEVSLKHYLSCKVTVDNMTLMEHSKYPVYCNCKLYRQRIRERRAEYISKNSHSDDQVKSELDKTSDKEVDEKDDNETRESEINNIRKSSISSEQSSHKEDHQKQHKSSVNNKEEGKQSKDNENSKSDKKVDEEKRHKRKRYSVSPEKDKKRKKYKHIIVQDSTSGSDEMFVQSEKERVASESKTKSDNEEPTETKKLKQVQSESCDDDDKDTKKQPDLKREIEENNDSESKIVAENSTKQTNDLENKETANCIDTVSLLSDNEDDGTTSPIKSKTGGVKLVDINKLLQPGLVPINAVSTFPTTHKKKEKSHKCGWKVQFKPHAILQKIKPPVESEKLKQRRKEVAAFKPKEFKILVSRYELTQEYMKIHNISKIVKNGKVIMNLLGVENVEIPEDNAEGKHSEKKNNSDGEQNTENVSASKDDLSTAKNDDDEEKARNELLNDSDSSVDKYKKALLDDSDSDEQETIIKQTKYSRIKFNSSKKYTNQQSDNKATNLVEPNSQKKADKDVIKGTLLNNSDEECDSASQKDTYKIGCDKEGNLSEAESNTSKHSSKSNASKNSNKSNTSRHSSRSNTSRHSSRSNTSRHSSKSNTSRHSSRSNASKHSNASRHSSRSKTSRLSNKSNSSKSNSPLNEECRKTPETEPQAGGKVPGTEADIMKGSDNKDCNSSKDIHEEASEKPHYSDHEQAKTPDENLDCISINSTPQSKCLNRKDSIKEDSGSDISHHDDVSAPTDLNPNHSDNECRHSQKSENLKTDTASDNDDEFSKELEACSEREKTPEKDTNCISINSTPQSKHKHLKDSMEAKKMLLDDASSSDTEVTKVKEEKTQESDSRKRRLSESHSSASEIDFKMRDRSKESSSDDSERNKRKKKKRSKKLKKSKRSSSQSSRHRSSSGSHKSRSSSHRSGRDRSESNSSRHKMGRSKVKASGSSEPSSDATDTQDKHIDGLSDLSSLRRRHRRRRGSSSSSESTQKASNNMLKKKVEVTIEHDNMLEANSSGEESLVNSTASDDLPAVTISGLNGNSPISHLAKEDLLEESDTSNTDNKESEKSPQKDSDNESAAKSRRRKGTVLLSEDDSEVGSRKKSGNQSSDFELSDNDSEVNAKKKRKKVIDSDDASNSDDESGTKKRRRIKPLNDSDGSDSDSENDGKKHGRKNIRKVMGKDQLEEATKKAARQEKERIARISERQKIYNNLAFDESGKPDEVVLDKVVLDFDTTTKEPLIEVDRGLVKKLKPHQANGIKFMWDACFESVKRIKKDKGSGCILAHCMGLGKTLQVVSLTHTLLTHSKLTGVHRILVVCPLSTVLNWVNEYKMWLQHAHNDKEVDIYELSRHKQNSERAFQLQEWLDNGGVCVLGYEMFRNLSAENNKKFRKKMLKSFQESLVDPGPDLVVCDEGHLLKNEKTSLSQSMNKVRTLRRIVLTGTPLQNNLKEYYCMVQFVKPNLLGKYNEYLNRFVNPITNGQYIDSTEHDIKVMKRRSHVLHKMLDGAVQRRDYGVLAPFLPPKHEYVLFITLTDVQRKLYQYYMDNYSRRPLPGKTAGFLFPDFQSLQRVWTHPLVLKYNSERYEIMQQKKREREEEDSEGSLVDFIDDETSPDESSSADSSDSMSDMSDDSRKKSKKKANKKSKSKENKASTRRGTRANPGDEILDETKLCEIEEVKNENPTEWWIPLVADDDIQDLRNSHKLVLLFDILRQCEAIGDKLLVFSQSLYSLDLIEHFLGQIDDATQSGRIDEKLGNHVGSWSPGIDYFRLDGSTSCENRSIWCKNFNKEDNPRARLFLISTRAGGLGINLVAANRVVIFDVSWNPSHDVQSIFRVYRFGQKKPCYVYRFLIMGTMEEKIYERQVTKQAISKRVIDEQQIDRHYAENDLTELYKFEPHPPEPRELPPLPKDRLFAEMLKEHEKQIYKYHEHDSLLENKEEETLTEEERKAAWEDFENEKTRPPPVPFNNWPMQGLLQQQQQHQFALNAVVAMLRKDYPNLTEQQLGGMLPLIYNANPALMQKMNDMYKYTTPNANMLNPAMMNPGALGSTSSLQYEPPWQRQQQQQNQIRIQQLMQQQQNSAKYYAGGLGSRDPVAMALQQQRAREMLDTRARPRGRPPQVPRGAISGDIVELDSD